MGSPTSRGSPPACQSLSSSDPNCHGDARRAASAAHILQRGRYDAHGEPVQAGIPDAVSGAATSDAGNRLQLASWIVDRSNPLTARVIVNRFWQLLFGVGLVKTVDDFGSQGEVPSNQALLDWLAVDFMDSGWDTKRLFKTIMLGATYR